MWILLVMMTVVNRVANKRVRNEPRQISVETSGEGGESELDPKLGTLRRRKRAMKFVNATEGTGSRENPCSTSITRAGEENVDSFPNSSATATRRPGSREDTQPGSRPLPCEGNVSNTTDSVQSQNQRRKRGPNLNKKASHVLDKILDIEPSARITLKRDTYSKKFVGDSAIYFATEVGIVMRKFFPMEFHTWEKVPKENKEEMIDRLLAKFEVPNEDEALMLCVDDQMRRQWKRTRNTWKDYWKKNGGMTDALLARSKMNPNCRSRKDWDDLCYYWESYKAHKYADQMKHNRAKLVIPSRGGSRSIANHKFSMTNKETQLPPNPIELYHKLHFHPEKEWINEESRVEYENILQMKEQECTKLVSEGANITPEMEYEIEKKVVKSVCAKHKTLLSGWEASSGPVLRKKYMHIFLAVETSRSASKGEEDMESKYAALEEEVRINKEKVKQGDKKNMKN